MAVDDPEIRKELCAAWRAVRDRLVATGYAREAVIETMMDTALADLDELRGLQDATHFILKARSSRRKGSDDEVRPEPRLPGSGGPDR